MLSEVGDATVPVYGRAGPLVYRPGDRLILFVGGDVAFVMDVSLVGSRPEHATISLIALPLESHALTFVLTSTTSNSASGVVVSYFQLFEQPIT